MRGFGYGIIAAGLAVAVCIGGQASAQSKDPAAILAAARQALGGEAKLSAVRSFTATGRTRQVRGENLVPIEFEIFVELPDKYLRKDEVPAQESGPTATGFNGEELLVDPPPPAMPVMPGRAGGPPPAGAADAARLARVSAVKQDFARLTLGMFAASFASYPLTFSYVGEAEAPQGKADVIDCKGANNVTLRLFINQQTHLPIMVSWQGAPAGRGRGPMMMPPGGATPGAPGGRGGPPPTSGGAAAPGVPPSAPAGAAPASPPAGTTPAAPAGAAPAPGAPPASPAPGAPTGTPGAGPAPAGPPAPGARGAGPGGPPSPPVENRLYFADYREVDGLQFPFRLRRAVGADTIEETTFDRFRLNQKIDPRRFEPRK